MMRVVVISWPEEISGEVAFTNRLFAEGLEIFHLRKPDWEEWRVREFISGIEPCYRSRIMLHSYFDLAENMELRGIHFNQKNQELWENYASSSFKKSWATHRPDELQRVPEEVEYAFLSPLFPSLSKQGYKAQWSSLEYQNLDKRNIRSEVFALGGITTNNISQVKAMDFNGLALLGCIWLPFRSGDEEKALSNFRTCHKLCQQ